MCAPVETGLLALRQASRDRTRIGHTAIGAFITPFLGVTLSIIAITYIQAGIAQTLTSLMPVLIIPVVWILHRQKTGLKGIFSALVAVVRSCSTVPDLTRARTKLSLDRFIFEFPFRMFFMNKKKRIGLLTLVIFIANMIITFIDAVVAVTYKVVPEVPSSDFYDLVVYGPVWWKINPIIIITIIGVGLTAFFLGNNTKFQKPNSKIMLGYVPLILTFVTISLSGLGDIMSQTFIELLSGNNPAGWIHYEWWWTMYMPAPAFVAALASRNIPTGIDMLIGSTIGIVILCITWLNYYEKISFTKIRGKIQKRVQQTE